MYVKIRRHQHTRAYTRTQARGTLIYILLGMPHAGMRHAPRKTKMYVRPYKVREPGNLRKVLRKSYVSLITLYFFIFFFKF